MTRSTYFIEHIDSLEQIIRIVDLDEGMSVTNDAENVVREVNAQRPGYRILYRDTMGNWDELLHDNGIFQGFAPYRK